MICLPVSFQSIWRYRWRSTWSGCQRCVSWGPRRGRGSSGLAFWGLLQLKVKSSPSWIPTVKPMLIGYLRCWVSSMFFLCLCVGWHQYFSFSVALTTMRKPRISSYLKGVHGPNSPPFSTSFCWNVNSWRPRMTSECLSLIQLLWASAPSPFPPNSNPESRHCQSSRHQHCHYCPSSHFLYTGGESL